MSNTIIAPCSELKDVVSHFWTASDDTTGTYYATATTRIELIFGFKASTASKSVFTCSVVEGQSHSFAQYPAAGFSELFGVSLYPNAVPRFFNRPATDLNNRFIGLETLVGKDGSVLSQAMANASTREARVNILTEYFKTRLIHRVSEDKLIIQSVKKIRKCKGSVNINELAAELHLSAKQFERRFRTALRFNPKLYARIVRFESVLRDHHSHNSLTETAYAAGYYDQAHLINDFKKFSGFSPTRFFELTRR